MSEFFSKIQQAARKERLSTEEKQRMRVALYEQMQRHPREVGAPAAVPSPVRVAKSPYVFLSPAWAAALALLLVVGLGSGTAFAAQGALPGSALYTVKVRVNEPIQVALAQTPAAKAQVNASIAQTRLQEAEALAQQGQLNASTSAELAANFDAHAQAAQDIAQSLDTEDPATAAQISTEFDSALQAHGQILAQLSNQGEERAPASVLAVRIRAYERGGEGEGKVAVAMAMSAPASTSAPEASSAPVQGLRTFAAKMNTQSASSSADTATTSATAAATSSEPVPPPTAQQVKTAQYMQSRAQAQLIQAQTLFGQMRGSLDASTTAQIQTQVDDIQARLAAGASALSSNDALGALANFEAALRASVTLVTYLNAGSTLRVQGLLPALFNVSEKGGAQSNASFNGRSHGKGSKGDAHSDTQQSDSQQGDTSQVASPTQADISNTNENSGDSAAASSSGSLEHGDVELKVSL